MRAVITGRSGVPVVALEGTQDEEIYRVVFYRAGNPAHVEYCTATAIGTALASLFPERADETRTEYEER